MIVPYGDMPSGWRKVYIDELLPLIISFGNSASTATKVIHCLIQKADSENYIRYTQQEIADSLNLSIKTIKRVYKRLIEQEFLIKTHNKFVINPYFIMCLGKGIRSTNIVRTNRIVKRNINKRNVNE